jgi:Protein of unknown function (DUF1592)/Protein of unknown function (DUF1588)/Protein of unknown function (DUF1595)/Protein of unknown function (DUF1587)/Protein of unknown function (DUF1585)
MRSWLARIMNSSCAALVSALLVVSAAPIAAFGAEKAAPMQPVGGPAVMRRITQEQYRNIIRDVFGPNISLGGRFEPDVRAYGLIAIGAGTSSVTASGAEQYDKIARSIGDQVVEPAHRDEAIPCKPKQEAKRDDSCAEKFLSKVGTLLYRRPLTKDELKSYVQAAGEATGKVNDFYKGLSLSLAGILVSPQFLYVQEFSEPDPAAKGSLRLNAYSKAQRLSLFLWNTSPDPTLLAAAKSGEIHTAKGLNKQLDRMLASPRMEHGVRAFFTDMLDFETFETLAKDSTIYPKFTSASASQAEEQTLRTIVDLLWRDNGDFRDLFTTRKTELTPLLASLYGVPIQVKDGLLDAWAPYEFGPDSGQSGILTQVSFVALHSHPGRSSPTLRGRALREILLCQKVPDPPGNVNFNLVQDTSNPNYKTVRQRLAAHSTEAMCKGCHKITDPIGFALENFDTIGGHRVDENGAPIDASGELDGATFKDAVGLGKAMHDNAAAQSCAVKRSYEYGVGRENTKAEGEWLNQVALKEFAASGYKWPALMRILAGSDTFYRVVDSNESKPSPSDSSKTPAAVTASTAQ